MLALAALLAVAPASLWAQTLPAGPARAFDGRLVVSGDATVTIGADDEIAFFNYTDYEHNALRTFHLGLSALARPADWVSFVGDLRAEGSGYISMYAAYVRVHPFRRLPLDIQAGRIPPSFGAYGRRAYAGDSAFIGYPLGYQYLTSLRDDAVPVSADDLLRMRGRGWLASYPVGSPVPDAGMPLVSAFRWDTGVQAHWSTERLDLSGSITRGTLSNPRVRDNNRSRQLSGRIGVTPVTGLVLGASAARGAWADEAIPGWSHTAQTSLGVDGEYSRGHWLVRGEAIWSRFTLPSGLTPTGEDNVHAVAAWAEGRYRITPRIFTALRVDGLGFSRITGRLFGGAPTPWDAPVSRVEAIAGYYLQRNLVARAGVQSNWREGGRVRHRTYLTAQLSYWF